MCETGDKGKGFQIDPRVDAYRTFFDHDWATKTLELAAGTVIAEATFDLLASWKAVSNAHRMPWALMKFIDSFWEGFVS